MAVFRILLVFLILVGTSLAWSKQSLLCLNARYTNNPVDGHVFLTIESANEEILKSYGFWESNLYPGSLAIDYEYDRPQSAWQSSNDESKKTSKVFQQEKNCQPLNNGAIRELKNDVQGYITRIGSYSALTNNCTHFAIHYFNKYTRDEVPFYMTPRSIGHLLRATREKSLTLVSEYQKLLGIGGELQALRCNDKSIQFNLDSSGPHSSFRQVTANFSQHGSVDELVVEEFLGLELQYSARLRFVQNTIEDITFDFAEEYSHFISFNKNFTPDELVLASERLMPIGPGKFIKDILRFDVISHVAAGLATQCVKASN